MAADLATNQSGSYRYIGSGTDLALEVRGPSVESCLARAVEGVSAALADVHPSIVGRSHAVTLTPGTPASLLRGLLDAGVALHRGGEIAVGVLDVDIVAGVPRIVVEAVPVLIDLPGALSWQTLTLERDDGHWLGRIVAHFGGD